ncbi:MAG: hypothetical protein AABY13_05250 [Nanoarchaeota archaeon]
MVDHSQLVRDAWQGLYPEEAMPYDAELNYTGRFAGLNANIRLYNHTLSVGMSKNWRRIDKEIQKGLIQELIVKLRKDRIKTTSMDLYRIFLKHAHLGVEKTKSDPILEACFNRVNDEYFGATMERPNLVWSDGVNRLGFYDYGRDQIALSQILLKDDRLLDYVMYHEMLHKKHKFSSGAGRTVHHSKEFRQDEAKFKDAALLEHELTRLVQRRRFWSF